MLLTWLFFTPESSRHSLAGIQEDLRKELNCQVRYTAPRELGTFTGTPQTSGHCSAQPLAEILMLEGSQNIWNKKKGFLACFLELEIISRPVLSALWCCDSRRSSDSHITAREKLLCIQARALSLPNPWSFQSFEWCFEHFLSLSSPCLPSQVPPCSCFFLCCKTCAVKGEKILGFLSVEMYHCQKAAKGWIHCSDSQGKWKLLLNVSCPEGAVVGGQRRVLGFYCVSYLCGVWVPVWVLTGGWGYGQTIASFIS